jgi:flagellar protein FliL
MAERTTETRNGREEGAADAAPAAPAKSGASAWMPLIITVALMPVLAFVMTRFVLVPQMKKAMGVAAAPAAASASGGSEGTNSEAKSEGSSKEGAGEGHSKVTVPIAKILVNVAGTMGTRYLMTSITLVGADENMKDKVDRNKDQLLDLATGTLSTKTISDLEKPGAHNVIRAELMIVFNNALGGPIIKEIYITELAIQ